MKKIFSVLLLFILGCYVPLKKADFLLKESLLNFKKAEQIIKEYLQKHPQDKKAKLLLAKIYYQKSEFQKAFEIYENMKDYLDPESQIIFSEILIKKNLFEEAKKILKTIKVSNYRKSALLLLKKIEKKISKVLPPYLEELMTQPISQEDIECGAQILLVDEVVQITPDNKEITSIHFVARILNERGKELGEVKIGYDSTYEYIAELEAQTITKDRRVIKVGKENIRDVSRYLEFPLYSNARVRIISMPECVPGSVIEYKAKLVRTKLVNKKDFSIIYVLKERYPIKIARFKLIVPKDRKINIYKRNSEFNFENFNLDPFTQENENTKIYKWEFKNIPPIIKEPFMPPISEINPYILITSFSNWREIYNWWRELYKDKIIPSPEIKEKVKELIEKKDRLSALKEIFKFCCENIRYVAVEYGRAGHTPHYAKDIFLNKYGDCKDQSILLVSMLRNAGIKAWPVLISTRDNFEIKKTEPSLNFNHCITLAKVGDKFYFLDPTAETSDIYNLPFSDQNRIVLVFFDQDYKLLRTPLKKENEVLIQMDLSWEDKLTFKRKVTAKGEFVLAQRYFLKYTHPKIFKERLLERAKNILKDAELKNVEIKNLENLYRPLILSYEFSGNLFFKDLGKYKVLPSLSQIHLSSKMISAERRKFPLFLGLLKKHKTKIVIPLPSSFEIYFLPPQIDIESKWFKYHSKCYTKNNRLYYEELYEIEKQEVSLEKYGEFKKEFEKLLFLKDMPIIFKYEENKKNPT